MDNSFQEIFDQSFIRMNSHEFGKREIPCSRDMSSSLVWGTSSTCIIFYQIESHNLHIPITLFITFRSHFDHFCSQTAPPYNTCHHFVITFTHKLHFPTTLFITIGSLLITNCTFMQHISSLQWSSRKGRSSPGICILALSAPVVGDCRHMSTNMQNRISKEFTIKKVCCWTICQSAFVHICWILDEQHKSVVLILHGRRQPR